MSLVTPAISPSPIDGLSLFDDFMGTSKNDFLWAISGVDVAPQDAIGGRFLITSANTSSYGEMYLGNKGMFSIANHASVKWCGILTPGSGSVECGIDGAGNQATEWICWITGSPNFRCQCGSGGSTSMIDSGVAMDGVDHVFEIITFTGFAQFFIDGVFKATINSNVPTTALQPYVWVVGTGSANMDYVLVQGDR